MAKPRRQKTAPIEQALDRRALSETSPWERRGSVLLAGASLFLFVFFLYAGWKWAEALYRLLTDGALLLIWLAAMAGAGVWLLRLFRLQDRAAGFVTCVALGIGFFSLLTLGLGLCGALNRVTAFVLICGGIAAGIACMLGACRSPGIPEKVPDTFVPEKVPDTFVYYLSQRIDWTTWLWLLVVPFLAIAVLGAFMPPPAIWGPMEPNGYDVVEYHLQVPREWFEARRILPLHHNVFSYFPFNVEMHYLLAMHLRGGPWAGMYLAQLMHVAMIVLSIAAIRGFAGPKGLGGVLLAASTPWLTMLAPVAYNEGGVLLFGTLAIGWTLRAITTSEKRLRLMALAGVMAGFACGVKLTAVPMLLIALPIAFVIAMLLRRDRRFVRPIAMFLICGLLVFAPWLIRNYFWTRNPVFPEAMSILGRAHFSPEQEKRWQMTYVPPPAQRSLSGRLSAGWDQIAADWRFGFVLIPAALFAIVRGRHIKEMTFHISLLLMWLLFWLFFTHLQGRFYVLAIPVIALLAVRLDAPIARLAIGCAVLLQTAVGLMNLQVPIADRLERFLPLLGIQAPPVGDEQISEALASGHDLCLIGDAQAFLYNMPMHRLHYRTVFDVDVRGRKIEDAWFDGWPRNQGDTIIIDYAELRRFAWKPDTGTGYWMIPGSSTGPNVGRVIVKVEK